VISSALLLGRCWKTFGSQMSGVTSPGRGSQARNAAVAGESLRDLELDELLVRSQEDVV
jgi:hypothetical protein